MVPVDPFGWSSRRRFSAIPSYKKKDLTVKRLKGELKTSEGNSLGLPPTQDASHHQDYETFLAGKSQPKPSFATVTGWGVDPRNSFDLLRMNLK